MRMGYNNNKLKHVSEETLLSSRWWLGIFPQTGETVELFHDLEEGDNKIPAN